MGEDLVHEESTVRAVEHGILDLSDALASTHCKKSEILDILKATSPGGNPRRRDANLWYSSLVGNYGMDLDRVDFVLRDLHFIGYPNRLLKQEVGFESKDLSYLALHESRQGLVKSLISNVRLLEHDKASLLHRPSRS